MANHCIDIICLDCGYTWCARCGDNGYIGGDFLQMKRDRLQKEGLQSGHSCPKCKSNNTYID